MSLKGKLNLSVISEEEHRDSVIESAITAGKTNMMKKIAIASILGGFAPMLDNTSNHVSNNRRLLTLPEIGIDEAGNRFIVDTIKSESITLARASVVKAKRKLEQICITPTQENIYKYRALEHELGEVLKFLKDI